MPSLDLPTHALVTADALRAIAARHGVDPATVERLPETGIFTAIYHLGEHLALRVPRDHPAFVAAIETEAVAVPAARAAGVRRPRLIVTDRTCALLPVPFAIYERVHGDTLERLQPEPDRTPDACRAVEGRCPASGLRVMIGIVRRCAYPCVLGDPPPRVPGMAVNDCVPPSDEDVLDEPGDGFVTAATFGWAAAVRGADQVPV
ncbi:MAG: hypothetical protein M3O34_17975 [Chloroflexota bacterium]|nr:hypothetical protein [Chloroflexota bacterium]